MPHPSCAGNKRKARLAARDARAARAVQRRLQKIYAYARLLRSEEELDLFLQQQPDDAIRAETKKLIEPFCLFTFRKVVLADAPLPSNVAPLVAHHTLPGHGQAH